MLKKFVINIIVFYQKTLSPDHGFVRSLYPGGYCKYEPSCSEYCRQSVEKYGVAKGSAKGIWRIIRCNPWSKGGSDPV
jgi:putative membrane protein insertion efficiency factor